MRQPTPEDEARPSGIADGCPYEIWEWAHPERIGLQHISEPVRRIVKRLQRRAAAE